MVTTTPLSRPPPGRGRGAGPGLVQDTAWTDTSGSRPGSSRVTTRCSRRSTSQLGRAPDLVAVPVGVGSLAQAAVTHLPPSRDRQTSRALGRARQRGLSARESRRRRAGARGHGRHRDGRAQLRNGVECCMAGAPVRLRRRCRRERRSARRAVSDLVRLGVRPARQGPRPWRRPSRRWCAAASSPRHRPLLDARPAQHRGGARRGLTRPRSGFGAGSELRDHLVDPTGSRLGRLGLLDGLDHPRCWL